MSPWRRHDFRFWISVHFPSPNNPIIFTNILSSAEDVIHIDQPAINLDNFLLEPTPIGPFGFQGGLLSPHEWPMPCSLVSSSSQSLFNFPLISCQPAVVTPTSRPSKKQRLNNDAPIESTMSSCQQAVSDSNEDEAINDCKEALSSCHTGNRFRQYQSDQWLDRFEDLAEYKRENGHCLVPHNYPPNQQLAQWTKRQRSQFKLKNLGRHSTLTDEREKELEEMGFIWDSHRAAWEERFESLKAFLAEHKYTNVPSNYEVDKPLAFWVKCQRRQMKLYRKGVKSTMTRERIETLESLGFDWNPRNL